MVNYKNPELSALELAAGSLRAFLLKRDELPLAAESHLNETIRTLAPYEPSDGYSEGAASLRQMTLEFNIALENHKLNIALSELLAAMDAHLQTLKATVEAAKAARK